MGRQRREHPIERWPRWWRMLIVAAGALILCSCRSVGSWSESLSVPSPALPHQEALVSAQETPLAPSPAAPEAIQTAYHPDQSPEAASPGAFAPQPSLPPPTAAVPIGMMGPPAVAEIVALQPGVTAVPPAPIGPWAPPGFRQPWPPDEYLVDGGDLAPQAVVKRDWSIHGLAPSETIAHFDTLDGRRVVEPANPVYIYSPRFGAVRQVVSLRENEQRVGGQGVSQPVAPAGQDANRVVLSSKQHLQPLGEVGGKTPVVAHTQRHGGTVGNASRLAACHDAFLPFEDLSIIRQGVFEASEMACLARGVAAAQVWAHTAVVQVFIDHQRATAEVGRQQVDTLYTVKQRPASPKLRVVKVASTAYAAPGETVDFTIRFDNVGDQVIGNVTIVDNLTTRLEYVPDTAQCSLPGQFSTEPSESQSLVLRWEIADPLPPGSGGIIRFRCRVR